MIFLGEDKIIVVTFRKKLTQSVLHSIIYEYAKA